MTKKIRDGDAPSPDWDIPYKNRWGRWVWRRKDIPADLAWSEGPKMG